MNARAAILLQFHIAADATAEHDDWHTHEHLPERLALPGFLRGTRWTAISGPGDYCVLYELSTVDALESPEYRHRLDHPTAWTSRIMPAYSGMRRTLCAIEASGGAGMGGLAAVVAFAPQVASGPELGPWLVDDVLRPLEARRGFASWHLLRSARAASVTKEQAIRGRDAAIQAAVVLTAYDEAALAGMCEGELGPGAFEAHGANAEQYACSLYRLAVTLSGSTAEP